MTTLANYITQTRRLLHDATGNFWSDSELIDYINGARLRVVADTGCNRVLQSVTLLTNQEVYPYSGLPQGANTLDILNVTVLWGSMRVPLDYMVFTEFNMKLRAWQNFTARPVCFTVYGQKSIYVGPIPDQNYSEEFDTIVYPGDLVNTTDVDSLMIPFIEPIPFYAASLAKYKEQSYEEANRFEEEYKRRAMVAVRSSFTRRLPSASRTR